MNSLQNEFDFNLDDFETDFAAGKYAHLNLPAKVTKLKTKAKKPTVIKLPEAVIPREAPKPVCIAELIRISECSCCGEETRTLTQELIKFSSRGSIGYQKISEANIKIANDLRLEMQAPEQLEARETVVRCADCLENYSL